MATIDSLLGDVRPMIATSIPDRGIRDALRWSAREFMRKTRWLRETIPVDVAENINAYSLEAATEDCSVFAVQAAQFEGSYLTPATQEEVRSGQHGWYFFEPPADVILSWTPAADAAGALLVRAVLVLGRDATTIPDAVLEQWDSTIQHGALNRLLSMAGAPWFNAPEAAKYLELWNAGLLEARQQAETQSKAYAYGSVQG